MDLKIFADIRKSPKSKIYQFAKSVKPYWKKLKKLNKILKPKIESEKLGRAVCQNMVIMGKIAKFGHFCCISHKEIVESKSIKAVNNVLACSIS